MIRGFELSGIYPLNPDKVNMVKLAPASLYKKKDPLPEIANESFMNEREGNVPEVNVAKVPNANEASTPSGDIGNRTNQEVEPQLQLSISQVLKDLKDFK